MTRTWGRRRCLLCSLSLDDEPEGVVTHAKCVAPTPREERRCIDCYAPVEIEARPNCGRCRKCLIKRNGRKALRPGDVDTRPMAKRRETVIRMWVERREKKMEAVKQVDRIRARESQASDRRQNERWTAYNASRRTHVAAG